MTVRNYGNPAISSYVMDDGGYYDGDFVEGILAEIYEALTLNDPTWDIYVNSLRIEGDSIEDSGDNTIFAFDGAGDVTQIGSVVPAAGEVLGWSAVNNRWEPTGAPASDLASVLTAGNESDGTDIQVDEGSDIIIYSDDGVTEVARIDGATGNIFTSGTVDGIDVSEIALDNMPAAPTSDVDFNTQNITNVGTVDGIDVSSIVAFKTITGITNDVVADDIADTLTLSSATACVTIVGTSASDTITWTLLYDSNDLGIDGSNQLYVKDGGIDHGSLGGLSHDDHSQYLLENGSRELSADWDAGSHKITAETFESDIATGTAPLTIASTTLVNNLNADLLDGEEAAAFLQKDGSVALTANWDAGGFEIRAETFESDVVTGTAPLVVASTTLVTNLNADLWDGNEFADYLNQAVKTGSSPTFTGLTITNAITEFSTDGTLGDDSDSAVPTEKAVKAYVDNKTATLSSGLDWQESVLDKDLATPPGAPSSGDRYIVASGGTDAWLGHDDDIAEYNGSGWDFYTPDEGTSVWVEDEDAIYAWDGASWVKLGSVVDHGNLAGLGDDDHSQYLLADGTRGLTGNWDAGAHQIRAETFQSDVTTGTAPLTVASTTLVANLNADTVDGKDETAFLLEDGSRGLSGDWDVGSHKITAEQLESDIADGTTPLIITSTTLVSNLNADQVDGYDASDIDYSFVSGNDAATNITAAELETLTDGSSADSLHTHTGSSISGIDISADTNLGVSDPITLTGDTIGLDYEGTDFTLVTGTLTIDDSGIDHGSLSGLGDKADHTWALTKDGTRALTANWDAGGFEIRAETFQSDVATGTAPLTVASTTLVSNLNADLWDGNEFADYLDQSVKTTSSPTFAGLTLTGNIVSSASRSIQLNDGAADTVLTLENTDATYELNLDVEGDIIVGGNVDGVDLSTFKTNYDAHVHDGDTLQLDGINSDGGAFAFDTTGTVTFNQDIATDGDLTASAINVGCNAIGRDVEVVDDILVRTSASAGGDALLIHADTNGGTLWANTNYDPASPGTGWAKVLTLDSNQLATFEDDVTVGGDLTANGNFELAHSGAFNANFGATSNQGTGSVNIYGVGGNTHIPHGNGAIYLSFLSTQKIFFRTFTAPDTYNTVATLNASGDLQIDGDLTVSGGDITLDATGGTIDWGGAHADYQILGIDDLDSEGYADFITYGGVGIGSNTGTNRQWFTFTDGTANDNIFVISSSTDGGSNWYERFSVQQDGDTYIDGDLTVSGGTIKNSKDNEGLYLGASDDLNIYWDGSSPIYNAASGVHKFRIGGSTKLQVGNNVTVDGDLTVSGGDITLGSQLIDEYSSGIRIRADEELFFHAYYANSGSNPVFRWLSGSGGTRIMELNTAGSLTIDGDFTVSGGDIFGTGSVVRLRSSSSRYISVTDAGSHVSAPALGANVSLIKSDVDFSPDGTGKTLDQGNTTYPWDEIYADNFNNVSCEPYFKKFDDPLAVIRGIRTYENGEHEEYDEFHLNSKSLPEWVRPRKKAYVYDAIHHPDRAGQIVPAEEYGKVIDGEITVEKWREGPRSYLLKSERKDKNGKKKQIGRYRDGFTDSDFEHADEGVSINKLLYLSIQAIQQLDEENQSLKERIKTLEMAA